MAHVRGGQRQFPLLSGETILVVTQPNAQHSAQSAAAGLHYHLLLDEHGDQIFAMTDPITERARKIGGTTLRSIGQIARQQRILDNDQDYVWSRRTCWLNFATTTSNSS